MRPALGGLFGPLRMISLNSSTSTWPSEFPSASDIISSRILGASLTPYTFPMYAVNSSGSMNPVSSLSQSLNAFSRPSSDLSTSLKPACQLSVASLTLTRSVPFLDFGPERMMVLNSFMSISPSLSRSAACIIPLTISGSTSSPYIFLMYAVISGAPTVPLLSTSTSRKAFSRPSSVWSMPPKVFWKPTAALLTAIANIPGFVSGPERTICLNSSKSIMSSLFASAAFIIASMVF